MSGRRGPLLVLAVVVIALGVGVGGYKAMPHPQPITERPTFHITPKQQAIIDAHQPSLSPQDIAQASPQRRRQAAQLNVCRAAIDLTHKARAYADAGQLEAAAQFLLMARETSKRCYAP